MPGKGSKYREFYDLSGRIACMIVTVLFRRNHFSADVNRSKYLYAKSSSVQNSMHFNDIMNQFINRQRFFLKVQ